MAANLRLQRLTFKAGSAPGKPVLDVETPNVTILVGPNNSGKSRTLREIEAICCANSIGENLLLSDVEISLPQTSNEILDLLSTFRSETPPGHQTSPNHFWLWRPKIRTNEPDMMLQVPDNAFESWLANNQLHSIKQYFVKFLTVRLDGRTRFELVDPKPTGPLENRPKNNLWSLFVDEKSRDRVRRFTEEAFGRHFVIDPTGMTSFRVRLSDRAPSSESEEQSLDDRSRAFHAAAPLISDLGDGVQTSVGLVSAIMSLPDRILLIDEPEAFLHPTLARRVGRVLSEVARERDASLVVATHSSEFLLGCLQSTPDLRLVRLSFESGQASARSIEPSRVTTLMNDPLLRSAHAMRALFHRGVIVCEADADRAFYEEVNSRLLASRRGIEDALFMNGQNWQTIPKIVAPLRSLGVPAVAIFDFDVLMDDDFAKVWPLINLAKKKRQLLEKARSETRDAMATAGRAACKSKGLDALEATQKAQAIKLLKSFATQGVLFVPIGELECWLRPLLSSNSKKSNWLVNIFSAMGNDPTDTNYLTAGSGDVWDFVGLARDWIKKPRRLGMPS